MEVADSGVAAEQTRWGDSSDYTSRKVWTRWKIMEECLSKIEKKGFTMIEMGSDESSTTDGSGLGWGRGGLKQFQRWKFAEGLMLLMEGRNEREERGVSRRERVVWGQMGSFFTLLFEEISGEQGFYSCRQSVMEGGWEVELGSLMSISAVEINVTKRNFISIGLQDTTNASCYEEIKKNKYAKKIQQFQ